MHFCPHTDCDYRGWLGLGNLRANGHPNGGLWRQFHCTACQGYFPEHHGTIFHGKQIAVELIVRVLACLAEGLGIRATARVFEVDPTTVLRWLVEAAEQLQAFSRYFLCAVHVEQVQLDELYAVLREVEAGALTENDAIERLERSRYWVWTAMDPESKLLLVIDVGTRTMAMAQRVVHHLVQMLAPDCVPLFVTDGFKDYAMALLTHFGHWMQPERRQHKGPVPKPRWMPEESKNSNWPFHRILSTPLLTLVSCLFLSLHDRYSRVVKREHGRGKDVWIGKRCWPISRGPSMRSSCSATSIW